MANVMSILLHMGLLSVANLLAYLTDRDGKPVLVPSEWDDEGNVTARTAYVVLGITTPVAVDSDEFRTALKTGLTTGGLAMLHDMKARNVNPNTGRIFHYTNAKNMYSNVLNCGFYIGFRKAGEGKSLFPATYMPVALLNVGDAEKPVWTIADGSFNHCLLAIENMVLGTAFNASKLTIERMQETIKLLEACPIQVVLPEDKPEPEPEKPKAKKPGNRARRNARKAADQILQEQNLPATETMHHPV